MKTYLAGLLNDVTSIYDKTKTTIAGRVTQKTLPSPYNSTQVLGAPLTKFIDTQTDTLGTLLPGMMYLTNNNRLFVLMSVPVVGVTNQIAMYNFNSSTGAYSYVGKIAFAVGSLTIAMKGFKVDDSNTSNIKIFLGHTATVVTTGAVLMINKVTLASFVPIGFPTFYTALANDVAAVYSLQTPFEVGGANLMTTIAGIYCPATYSVNSAINTKLYVHNGISATHQKYIYDYSTGPTLASTGVGTTTAVTTASVFTATGNTLAVGDPVVFLTNTASLTASTASSAQTVYYVVAANFVAGSTFSVALTFGGVAIGTLTPGVSGTTFARGLGQSSNNFVVKTANLPSLGAGTLLLTNSENYCVPSSGANSGQECVFMATSTNFLQGRLADLYSTQTGTLNATTTITGLTTAGLNIGQTVYGTGIPALTTISTIAGPTSITISNAATTSGSQSLNFGASLWSSMLTVNVIGSGIDYVTPTPLAAAYDASIDRVVYQTSGAQTMVKQFVSSVIESNFGSTGNFYMEAQNHITDPLQLQAVTNFDCKQGWAFYSSGVTVGQRGIIALDLRSDAQYSYSYIVSPVISTPGLQTLTSISSIEQMFDVTGSLVFQYRTSANLADAVFNTATSGWTTISTATTLNIALNNYTQFRALSSMIVNASSYDVPVTTHAQVSDIKWSTALLAEISDYWDFSYNDSSSAIPTRVGFNLRTAYATGTVPKMYFRAYDVAGNLLTTADTVTNSANFQYSTDAGVTWLPMGTIPNIAGTRIRYTHSTPPGVDERVSLKES
jgi:hypothetical protein